MSRPRAGMVRMASPASPAAATRVVASTATEPVSATINIATTPAASKHSVDRPKVNTSRRLLELSQAVSVSAASRTEVLIRCAAIHTGLAGVSVLTEEFRDAFENQKAAIGLDAASIYVPHPMQNKTTAELHAFAEQSVDEILAAICAAGAPKPVSRAA